MNVERMDIAQARERLSEVLKRVEKTRRPVLLTCDGHEVGALVPMQTLEFVVEAREARHQAFLRAGEQMPDYPEEEVERDIAEALAAVRRQGATSSL